MKGKQTILLGVLVATFLGTSGMFYYQNVYMEQESENNRVQVLVAKKDIGEGAEFTTENVGAILMETEDVLPTYVTSFGDLKGRTASSDLLNSEIITKPRIEENSNGSRLFTVAIVSKNIPVNIKKGDNVRMFVQATFDNKVYEVMDKKEVVSVNYKKSSSGKETGTISSIDLLMSDEEAVLYFNASKVGDLMFARYYDLTENNVGDVPKFTLEVAESLTASMSKKGGSSNTTTTTTPTTNTNTGKTNETTTTTSKPTTKPTTPTTEQPSTSGGSQNTSAEGDGKVTYMVNKRDTFESIATAQGITVEELKALNPGVTTLSAGDSIVVKK